MSDLSITAANVLAGTNNQSEQGLAGAAVTAGKAVYYDKVAKSWKPADCDDADDEIRMASKGGIALNGASAGQPLSVLTAGDITMGATLVPGTAYYLSPNAGGICPFADLSSGDYVVLIGLAKTAAVLNVAINYTGAQI